MVLRQNLFSRKLILLLSLPIGYGEHVLVLKIDYRCKPYLQIAVISQVDRKICHSISGHRFCFFIGKKSICLFILFGCVHGQVYINICSCAYVYTCSCGGQKSTLHVFFNHSTPTLFKNDLFSLYEFFACMYICLLCVLERSKE